MPGINCEGRNYYAVNQSGLYEFELIYWQNHDNFKLHVYLYEYSASRLELDDRQITSLPFYDHVRQHSLKPSDEITLKHAVVGSDAYFNARGHSRFAEAIRQTKCLADQSQEEQNTPLTIVHIIRDGYNDHYITFRPEDRRIYLNSCSGDDDFANTTPLALDFLHKTDHLYLTHAQASPGGIEITTEQGVILAINDALLLNATTVTPQPRIFLHEAPLYWYHVTGFARNSWLGWDLSITELEQRIWSELQRFPESVLAHSPPALPIVSNPEYLVRNNSNLTQEVDYASAPCPVKANSWYITSAERIFGFDPEYAVFGFDTDRGWLFATNEENRIFYLQIPDNYTSDTATEDDRGCPQPAVFNPHQIDLQRAWYLSHQVWGQDAQGRLYQVNREGQTLLGIDLQGWPFLWGLGNISISSITSLLDPLVNRLVHDTPKEHTEIASQLVLSLPKNISNTTYQAWYRTEDTVLSEKGSFIFRGKELVSFLGSTIATAISGLRDSIAWFFSPDSGTLYRQEGDTQTPVGNYDLVQLLGEGSSLVMMGTEGNDSMESVTIGRTDGYAVLYLDGLGGTDHYRITRQALSHYESIVIHNAVLTLSDNNVTQPQAPADTNDISIDAMANEFIISRVNDSLMLQHHPTRHSILLSSSLRVAPDNGTGPANTTQGQSLYEWADEHTIVSLDGLVASNEELLHSLAGLPAGYPRYLPLEVRRFGEGQTTTIPLWPGYPTLLDGDNLPPPVPEVGNSSLTLSFQAGNDTIGLYFPDYSYGAGAAADTLFYRHNQSMPYIPLLYLESGNPSFGFSHNDLNEYRPLTQTPDAGTVSCMAVEQLGRSWFIEQDHSQPLSAASGFWNHTGTDQQHFIFVPKKSGQQPEQLRVGWHWIIDEQSPEGDGCVTIAQSTEGGLVYLPEYRYSDVSVSRPGDNIYRLNVVDNQNKTQCILSLRDVPQGLMFAEEPGFSGKPLVSGDSYLRGTLPLPDPYWLSPERPPLLRLALPPRPPLFRLANIETLHSPGHPVIYNVEPDLLDVTYQEDVWSFTYQGMPVRYINSRHHSNFLQFSVVRQLTGSPSVQSVSSWLALPYGFTDWSLLSNNEALYPYKLSTDDNRKVYVLLPEPYNIGFSTEQDLSRQMLAGALGEYSGVFFSDGLQTLPALRAWLSSQPLTITNVQSKGSHRWSATGNLFNNIIPVQLSELGSYNINSGEGNDLILINGGFLASRISFPVRKPSP